MESKKFQELNIHPGAILSGEITIEPFASNPHIEDASKIKTDTMNNVMKKAIFTIGHSNYPIGKFLELLELHGITVICDVRSSPYSRFNPQYNRDALCNSLCDHNIKYVFLGNELGARSKDPSCYSDGRAQYDTLAKTKIFRSGIDHIQVGINRDYKMALMCAEKDPLDCHRTVLVARYLEKEGFKISHI